MLTNELVSAISSHAPKSLLLIADSGDESHERLVAALPDTEIIALSVRHNPDSPDLLPRAEVALLGSVEQWPPTPISQRWISYCRDVGAAVTYLSIKKAVSQETDKLPTASTNPVSTSPSDPLTSDSIASLGFERNGPLSSESLDIYRFCIADYKRTPDWLNSRFWANPRNWDKYRW